MSVRDARVASNHQDWDHLLDGLLMIDQEFIDGVIEKLADGDMHKWMWLMDNRDVVQELVAANKFLNDYRQPRFGRVWHINNRISDDVLRLFGERKLFGFELPRHFVATCQTT